MIERLRPAVEWGRRVSEEYRRTRASLSAGGLAYFVALSIAPAALAFGTIAGLILDPADVRASLEQLARSSPGLAPNVEPVLNALASTIESASASSFTITALVSALIAVYAASKVVFGLRQAMNTIFGVTETRSGLVERGVSAIVTLLGLLMAVALVAVLTILPRILDWLDVGLAMSTGSAVLDWAVALVLMFIVVRWLLKHTPNQSTPVPWASRGAAVGALGIAAATIGVGIYARFSASLSAAVLVFGTAVVLLLWLYLCFVALLWGAIIEADDQRARALVRTRTSEGDRPPGR